jgi:outer membrane murein-binding lipoprotein Lpp
MTNKHTRRKVLAVAGSTITLAGCTGESLPDEEQSPSDTVNAWLDEHEETEQEAVDQYASGNDAFEESDYSRAMMYFERATNNYESLEEALDSELDNYENGTETWELFSTLGQYYSFIRRASTWRYSAAYERSVNDDAVASDEALATSDDRFERAEELKQEFRDMMDN